MKAGPPLITSDEMQVAENNSEFLGVSHFQLMEVVGSQVAKAVTEHVPRSKANPRIDVVCGPGKNGGDGFSAARHLAALGYATTVTLVGKTSDVTDYAAKHQLNAILQMRDSIEFHSYPDSTQLRPFQSDLIIDALLGTGVTGELRQPILGAIRIVNKSTGYKVSIDLPSGLDSDTGEPHGDSVKADLTLCLHRNKSGLVKGSRYAGQVTVLPIGIPPEAETYAGPGDFKILWRERPHNAHKGDYGRLIVIGGSENFTGAPAYASLAATKMGTDLVYVAAPEKTAEIIASYSPDLITIKLPGAHLAPAATSEVEPWLKAADAIVLGPGIGLNDETTEAVWLLIAQAEDLRKPLILDADALKIFAAKKRKLKTPCILTPHAGEFSQLIRTKTPIDVQPRKEAAIRLASETSATIILKGPIDIIATENHSKFNTIHNPFMTVGGTGDVLTGIVGGLVAQHVEPFKASVAATFLNGLAGDLLLSEKGPTITSSQLLDYIPKAMKYCLEGPPYPPLKKQAPYHS